MTAFLLIIVWVLTALIGSLAVTRFYKSRTIAETSGSNRNEQIVFGITFIVIFVFLAALAYTLSSSAGHPKGGPFAPTSQREGVSRREIVLPPEATEGEVNRPKPEAITIKKESPIVPEETKGEVNRPTILPPPLVRKKEAPIKPEQ
jgi:hypothetical protein